MSKKWYTISFQAKLDDEDIRAMKSCFYDAMEEAMGIHECYALDIDDHCDQDDDEYDQDDDEIVEGI